jgi:asparagine synthase (glutamine-hydrolysing)
MIGGYVYGERDEEFASRLRDRLDGSFTTIDAWDHGVLFHDDPYPGHRTSTLVSDELIALTQDILAKPGPDGEYRRFDLRADLAEQLSRDPSAAFDSIANDYCMAAVRQREGETNLYLVSNRAGSGRMYYHALDSGVFFCSDLRFLLRVVRCDVNLLGIYSILKYGAIPDPMTICTGVETVSPAHFLEYDVRTRRRRQVSYFKLRFECDSDEGRARDESQYLPPVEDALRKSSRFFASHRPAMMLSGGIDSSLYGCYLSDALDGPLQGLYCQFGDDDPEFEFARQIAERTGSNLHVAHMGVEDALEVLDDVARWTDHPFSDFSSLPIAFLLASTKQVAGEGALVIECNGADDCFGFPDLASERKYAAKHKIPKALKRAVAPLLGRTGAWKLESSAGLLAKACAAADAHERSPLNYFLVLTPVAYLRLGVPSGWDEALWDAIDRGFAAYGEDYDTLSYGAHTTIRQLLQVNSRRWASKALSVGESLGLRVVYPFIWRDVLRVQGQVPWSAKVRDGVVKWPLKRLLEQHMPGSFIYRKKSGFVPPFARWLTIQKFNGKVRDILFDSDATVTQIVPRRVFDELLSDALQGRKLRHCVLNFLWGALFTEMWVREHGR